MADTDDNSSDPGRISGEDDGEEVLELTEEVSDDGEKTPSDRRATAKMHAVQPGERAGSEADESSGDDESDERDEAEVPSAAIVTPQGDGTEDETSMAGSTHAGGNDEQGASSREASPDEALKTVQMQAIDRRAIEREGQVRQLDQTLPLLTARFAPEIVVASPSRHVETWTQTWAELHPGDTPGGDSAPEDEAMRTTDEIERPAEPGTSTGQQDPPEQWNPPQSDHDGAEPPPQATDPPPNAHSGPHPEQGRSPQGPPETQGPPDGAKPPPEAGSSGPPEADSATYDTQPSKPGGVGTESEREPPTRAEGLNAESSPVTYDTQPSKPGRAGSSPDADSPSSEPGDAESKRESASPSGTSASTSGTGGADPTSERSAEAPGEGTSTSEPSPESSGASADSSSRFEPETSDGSRREGRDERPARSTPKGKPIQPGSDAAEANESTDTRSDPDAGTASGGPALADDGGRHSTAPSESADTSTPTRGMDARDKRGPQEADASEAEALVDELVDEREGRGGEAGESSEDLFALPPESEQERAEWLEDVFSEAYLLTIPESIPRQTVREADFIEASFEPDETDRMLDLACGFGRHAMELAKRGYQLVGFDHSKPLLEKALAEAERQSLQIKFFHGDMREMEFRQVFDYCFCWQTSFGYFDDRTNESILARINRSLQEGGEVLLDVVNRDYVLEDMPHRIWWEGMECVFLEEGEFDYESSVMHLNRSFIYEDGSRPPREQDYYIRLYSPHELQKMFERTGFEVLEISGDPRYRGYFLGADSPRIIVRAAKTRSLE